MALAEADQVEEAVAHYEELLRLNPDDHQDVRYLLLPALLELERDVDAARLLKKIERRLGRLGLQPSSAGLSFERKQRTGTPRIAPRVRDELVRGGIVGPGKPALSLRFLLGRESRRSDRLYRDGYDLRLPRRREPWSGSPKKSDCGRRSWERIPNSLPGLGAAHVAETEYAVTPAVTCQPSSRSDGTSCTSEKL